MAFEPGEIVSYIDMCKEEGVNLQRGMNFRLHGGPSIVLMSRRANAPYSDRVEDNGNTLIYEGHDLANFSDGPNPKTVDQPLLNPSGTLTANGLFYQAASNFKSGSSTAELVKVYEKIRDGIWVFNGIFRLVDAWQEQSNGRSVFKFRLELADDLNSSGSQAVSELEHTRMIPSSVKLAVWQRDKGRCVRCGRADNLHFDHIIPFSLGGTSLLAENIQLLCARHNLEKHAKID